MAREAVRDYIAAMVITPAHYPTRAERLADLVVHLIGLALALFGGGMALGLAVSHGLVGRVAAVSSIRSAPSST